MRHTIFGIHINHGVDDVPAVQAVLAKYGCSIRTRLGIHDADNTPHSPSGLVLVDVFGPETEAFHEELKAITGVNTQRMDFDD